MLTQVALRAEEHLISHTSIPALSSGAPLTAREERLLENLLETTSRVLSTLESGENVDLATSIRHLWRSVLMRGDPYEQRDVDWRYREWLLHEYLFFFWDTLGWNHPAEALPFDDVFVPSIAATWRGKDPFYERIGKVASQNAPVDMVARAGTVLYPVEIKYGIADDRAVGQLLRYFEFFRGVCHRRDHLCDLRRVTPVLIARGFPEDAWNALPTAFRELLIVYFYGFEGDALTLRDGRKALQGQMRARHSPYHF